MLEQVIWHAATVTLYVIITVLAVRKWAIEKNKKIRTLQEANRSMEHIINTYMQSDEDRWLGL